MPDTTEAPSDADLLRARLLKLRADTLRQLAAALPAIDTGLLAIAANASVVLDALADEAAEAADRTAAVPRA